MSATRPASAPSVRPSATSSRISSSEVTGFSWVPRNNLATTLVRNKSGLSTKVSPVTKYATAAANCATYDTPIVLGMISENSKTAMVNASENAQSEDSPMAFTYIAPQTEAPTVCATV